MAYTVGDLMDYRYIGDLMDYRYIGELVVYTYRQGDLMVYTAG